MALQNAPYRAHLSALGSQPLFLDILEQQLSGWLLEKRIEVEVRHDNDWEDGARRFDVWHHERSRGRRDLQAILSEHDAINGDWRTEVLASSDGWVDIEVTNARGAFVATPRLVRYLLQVMSLGDAGFGYVDGVSEVDVTAVPELLDMIQTEGRHGLIFVAGTSAEGPDDLLAAYAHQMPRWARETYGLAGFVRLTPDATELFAGAAKSHAVAPWTIRTFYPGPEFGDSIDARRHKYLTTRSLADMPSGSVTKMLGNIARTQALKLGDLQEIARVQRAMERIQHQQLISRLHEEMPIVQEGPNHDGPLVVVDAPAELERPSNDYVSLVGLLRDVLGIESPTEESLRDYARRGHPATSHDAVDRITAEIATQRERIDELEDERRKLQRLLDDDQLENAEMQEELESRVSENVWLRSRLANAGQYRDAYQAAPQDSVDYPDGFEKLLDRVAALAHGQVGVFGQEEPLAGGRVVFTGNKGVTIALDASDTLETAVRAAWECLLVLADYVRARDEGQHTGGVAQYLEATPSGYRQMSPKRHAANETNTTMQRYGKYRVFPVPETVRVGGKVEMVSHFKLARIGMVSPRLHYFDNYSANGHVYIGYIGPHLPNTQTN